ncbi:MAG: hypothetical protein FWF06_04525 [Symbiobacteriaceae bacterium]|nr:hypothetical protein [Symbiobacteriaceae bacterium]
MINKVVAGDYQGSLLINGLNCLEISLGWLKSIKLTKETVDSYYVEDSETKTSVVDSVAKAAFGAAILGPIGLFAGLGGKKVGTYRVVIDFKDGKRSMLELDKKTYHKLSYTLF